MKTGEELWKWYKDARDAHSEWKEEARELYDLRAGRQWTDEELAFLSENLRSAITFNRTGPLIDSAVGHQIYNRQQIQYLPREPGDVAVNEIQTGAVRWVDDESDSDTEISDAFEDALICGLGWTESRVDYDDDPEGKIIGAERVSPFDMEWDPASEKRNLSDARYFMRGKWFAMEIAKESWPDIVEYDMGSEWDMANSPTMAQHEHHIHDGYETGVSDYYRKHEDEVYVLQTQYYELKLAYLVSSQMGKIELPEDKYKRVKQDIEIQVQQGLARVTRVQKKRWFQAFHVGPNILEEGPAPSEDRPSLIPITGKRDTMKNQWYGICRSVKDPQKWANKFFSDTMDIVSKNRRGGAFVESDAFEDPRLAEEKWNDPAGLIMLTPGALGAGKVQERQPIAYPVGMDRLMEFAIRAIPDVTGINQELMGLVARNQPGVLEQQRKQAGLTILAGYFDSLRQYQKLRGRLMADFVKNFISDGRLVRILGEDGNEQFVPLTRDKLTQRYDVVVDQAPTSANTRETVFAVLRELLPVLQGMGIALPAKTFDYLPLPKSLVDDMKKSVAESKPQQAQTAQQAQILELQGKQADIDHKGAMTEKARTDAALAPYKVSIDAAKV